MPIPTTRALWLGALSPAPGVVALLSPSIAPGLIAFDVALVVLIALDFFLAPRVGDLRIRRMVEPVLSSGRVNLVRIEVLSDKAVRGELRDWVTPGPLVEGHRQRFSSGDTLEW